jgi:hypothetical protein
MVTDNTRGVDRMASVLAAAICAFCGVIMLSELGADRQSNAGWALILALQVQRRRQTGACRCWGSSWVDHLGHLKGLRQIEAFTYGKAKATGPTQFLRPISTVVGKQQERERLKTARKHA